MRAGGREWLVVSSAALGLMIAACVDSGDKNNDTNYGPIADGGATAGTGGTTGGVAGPTGGVAGPTGGVAGPTGGGTTGGVAGPTGGGTTGGVAGPTGGGTTGGVAGPTGGTTGGTGGTTSGTGGTAGGTMGGGLTPVRGTGTACTAAQPAAGGKCGSYYCGVNQASLAAELNPAKPCGTDAVVACKATLTGIVTKCAGTAQTAHIIPLALGDTTAFKADVESCVAADPMVMADKIPTACQTCFTTAAVCCAGNDACGQACLAATETKACEDAQKAAGCVNAVFDCGGLPNPF